MTDNYIQLNKTNELRLKIKTNDGKETGEELVFDLDDVELFLRYQQLIEKDKKNRRNFKNQIKLIEKNKDVKGNKLLSRNEEEMLKALNDYIKKQIEVYNMFLGKNGIQKLLNGRKVGWTTFDEINKIINDQILPQLQKNMKTLTDIIKEKYDLDNEDKSVI